MEKREGELAEALFTTLEALRSLEPDSGWKRKSQE